MPPKKKKELQKLNAYFSPQGFIIEEPEAVVGDTIKIWAEKFNTNKYRALFHIGFLEKCDWFSTAIEYLYQIASLIIERLSQQPDIELVRENIKLDLGEDECYKLLRRLPFVVGMEYVNNEWLTKLWNELLLIYKSEICEYDGTVARYFTEYNTNINVVGRVFFHLVENKNDQYPFAFMATYSTKPPKSKKAIHTPLKNALSEFEGDDKKLLTLISTVIKAAERSDFISGLMESGQLFKPLKITVEEAYTILKEIPIYEEVGIRCRVPDWWRKKHNSLRVSIVVGEKKPSKVGLNAIMDFSPIVCIGDERLTGKDLLSFLEMANGLVQYKGNWVEINKSKLVKLLNVLEKVKDQIIDKELSLGDAMRLELNIDEALNIADDSISVSVDHGQWFREMRETLSDLSNIEKVEVVSSFKANLRNYQEKGYQWINQMSKLGFGACLADDMGLGKTVQMLAYLEHIRVHSGGQALLILPASLIGNWQKEIEKFAPEMPYQILHRSSLKSSEPLKINDKAFLYLTTYGMSVRIESLKEREWDYLIIDEAQAIKNASTKQSRAIKAIPAKMRIAMTGTPIENHLGDLWSLFDFLNEGLLGTTKEFKKFTKELSNNSLGYAKLRKMIQPFILRRLKTDKSIIADLPDKIEINSYTTLSKKQVILYKQLLKQIEVKLGQAEGIERKGVVLSSIMKFKQICNHPDHYLGREDYKVNYSGKFQRLKEICEVIYEKRERVLIFTQFKEITEPISDFLAEIFKKEGFVLHGGTSIKKRNEMVEMFNGEHYVPYMILSLKAGGVGLNLTAANHVIHFDRWWNPAVENQATDRVFRIGQTKEVMVHKFVTKGTIEEKISTMIEEKQKLASDILGSSGEKWITEYSNEDLMRIFALGGDL
ncbi:DEAD/DEAH box helicase [Clostridium sp. 'deep sea']|uniref:DEAD/DEAH box helicase n=1 Tax=Clostridium sp. 'deep sea' TaxID=2779445 RepID=UPI001896787C|nr:DEAD/DEAH box helicase [Clostridium sp. 'deep sea']QOR33729.1 DEAD/DEAH box helicase [Clostridium sp. 'deep sea']